MGTLTGIGARPMAILYSNVETRRSAATQNAFYGFGTLVAIIALSIAGVLTLPQLAFAASLAPLVPIDLWVSRPQAVRFELSAIRPWVLDWQPSRHWQCFDAVFSWEGCDHPLVRFVSHHLLEEDNGH